MLDDSFVEMAGSAELVWTGQLVFTFSWAHVRFEVQWSNPLWSALNLSLATEQAQILNLAHLFAISLPTYNVSWGKLDPTHLALLAPDVLALGKFRSRLRWWYFWGIYMLYLAVSWGSLGLFAVLLFRLHRGGWLGKQKWQALWQNVLRWWDHGFELVND